MTLKLKNILNDNPDINHPKLNPLEPTVFLTLSTNHIKIAAVSYTSDIMK